MKKTLKDLNLKNKKVLVRCDFNVPFDKEGNITDDIRIRASLPTIKYLLDNGAAVILLSHLGRPDGTADRKYSLQPVAQRLSSLLERGVCFEDSDTIVDDRVKTNAAKLKPGDIMLLQNTRFRKEETKNAGTFAKELASLGELFVNDAFGTSHRAHSSNVGICEYLPSALGFLVEKEVEIMGNALKDPKRPLTAILGGAKVSDKISVIENLLSIADNILIGGGMMYTFLKAKGYNTGSSLLEEDKVELAKDLIKKAEINNVKLILPVDTVVAKEFKNDTEFFTTDVDKIPDEYMGLDIGEKTIEMYKEIIENSNTVIWNGPLGVFEMDNFANGTNTIAKAIADNKDVVSIIGGGDSAAAIEKIGLAENITHISTGGGASLEFLEGKKLPGIEAVDNKRKKLIAGNWKMNCDVEESLNLARKLSSSEFNNDVDVLVCPPFTSLYTVIQELKNSSIKVGAQNMHFEDNGAFTGEVSPVMLKNMGVEYVIIGHSERRQHFGETDQTINKKIKACLKHGLKPILCVGESLEQREAGVEKETVRAQLIKDLDGVTEGLKIVVAYEPIWAIGTGKTATSAQANEMASFIRTVLGNIYTVDIANNIIIQYGGSVKASNTKEIMLQSDIDGALVGGASLNADEFTKIANYEK
ncbi:MAG: triose-phosphate isomerase [Tissierellia bacterium]|nr:triose-phosphate isomerase [Tissierellia bacterium]MDD3226255.1 triose-phosphate isomerase [Tissierellia bacterium]MDD3750887.1 triose-phosphate isomerase [Tissierellia bacterium]MDD4678314.1 triose-phosphate isomerase [Tissierellia bacterium]